MIRSKNLWLMLALVVGLSFVASATAVSPWISMYVSGATGIWLFDNTTGMDVTGLQIEFDQEVTITNKVEFGGALALMPPMEMTGTAFTFVGSLINYGQVELDWEPASAVPTFAIWLSGARGVGTPFFTTVAKLGYLFGVGIVYVRENNPEALQAAFDQFFADNAEYLAGVSESLGMNLADSLMPIIMAAPAEGIENFFNTIIGMLGVTDLTEVTDGAVDFSALFGLLGL